MRLPGRTNDSVAHILLDMGWDNISLHGRREGQSHSLAVGHGKS